MRNYFLLVLVALTPLFVIAKSSADDTVKIRWGTFNIRYMNADDYKIGCGWDQRKERVVQYVTDNQIEICGMQEVTNAQLEYLRKSLKGYGYVGVGRTDGKKKGEAAPVFYRKDRFRALDKGNFWLSETPDVVGSKGWDAAIERVASWVKLKDKKTGLVFMAVNTHLDHVGKVARRESARLIMKKIVEIVGSKPAVVTGDFNVTENDEAYKTMIGSDFKMNDAYHMTKNRTGATGTWQSFCQIPTEKTEKIDFIFITPNIKVTHTHIEKENKERQISDHNPHYADLEL
ncbi:MAG: endonuclease/exonuclease/phosphatase family protein [Bacteroidaceae bacterium]|nr:endonuclease/exonuclease/phosphatase family protein [Bacteroidaceae bacterium]